MVNYNFRQLKTSEFFRNSLTLVTGSSVSQILPIIVAPILSRIYLPEDYGKVGTFISASLILSIVSTLQYSSAFLLPKEEKEFYSLVKLCFKNVFITSTFAMVLMLFLKAPLAKVLHMEAFENIFLLLPVSMFLNGIAETVSGFANRRKLFKMVAFNRTVASIANISVSLIIGFWLHSWIGLLMGFILNQVVNSLIFFYIIYRSTPQATILAIKSTETRTVRKKYIEFPKFSMITEMINTFTYQIPVFMLGAFAAPASVGFYNMCNRILGLPGVFISVAVSDVFKQKASEEFHLRGSCGNIYQKTFRSLLLLSVIPFAVLMIWGPDLFAFALGEKWREAGFFARLLAPVYLLRFINSPLSFIIYFFKKLKFDLVATIYLNVTSFFVLYFFLQNYSITWALFAFSINYSLVYIFMLSYSTRLSKTTL